MLRLLPLLVMLSCSPAPMLEAPQLWAGTVHRVESVSWIAPGGQPMSETRDPQDYMTYWYVKSCADKPYRTVQVQNDTACFFRLAADNSVMRGGPCELRDQNGLVEKYYTTGGSLDLTDGGVFTVKWNFEKNIGTSEPAEGKSEWTFDARRDANTPAMILDLCNTPDRFGK